MKRKLILTVSVILLTILSLILVAYFSINQRLDQKDVEFLSLDWSKDVNWAEMCNECRSQNCTAKAESSLQFPSIYEIKARINKSYIQCVEIVDGVDRYKTESASLNIPSQNFTTSESLDPTKPHTVEVCCGLSVDCETSNFMLGLAGKIRSSLGLTEIDYYQVCKTKIIDPGCS